MESQPITIFGMICVFKSTMLKNLTLALAILFSVQLFAGNGDKVATAIQNSNTTELATMFHSSIELVTPTVSNVYSKDQAKVVLDNFFKQNEPTKASVSHETNGSNTSMIIIDLTTKTGSFRVTVVANTSGGGFVINQFKIQ